MRRSRVRERVRPPGVRLFSVLLALAPASCGVVPAGPDGGTLDVVAPVDTRLDTGVRETRDPVPLRNEAGLVREASAWPDADWRAPDAETVASSVTLGPAGGVIGVPGVVSVEVPPGALPTSRAYRLTISDVPVDIATMRPLSATFTISPQLSAVAGTAFTVRVRVAFPVGQPDDAALYSSIAFANPRTAVSRVDDTYSARMTQLSSFALARSSAANVATALRPFAACTAQVAPRVVYDDVWSTGTRAVWVSSASDGTEGFDLLYAHAGTGGVPVVELDRRNVDGTGRDDRVLNVDTLARTLVPSCSPRAQTPLGPLVATSDLDTVRIVRLGADARPTGTAETLSSAAAGVARSQPLVVGSTDDAWVAYRESTRTTAEIRLARRGLDGSGIGFAAIPAIAPDRLGPYVMLATLRRPWIVYSQRIADTNTWSLYAVTSPDGMRSGTPIDVTGGSSAAADGRFAVVARGNDAVIAWVSTIASQLRLRRLDLATGTLGPYVTYGTLSPGFSGMTDLSLGVDGDTGFVAAFLRPTPSVAGRSDIGLVRLTDDLLPLESLGALQSVTARYTLGRPEIAAARDHQYALTLPMYWTDQAMPQRAHAMATFATWRCGAPPLRPDLPAPPGDAGPDARADAASDAGSMDATVADARDAASDIASAPVSFQATLEPQQLTPQALYPPSEPANGGTASLSVDRSAGTFRIRIDGAPAQVTGGWWGIAGVGGLTDPTNALATLTREDGGTAWVASGPLPSSIPLIEAGGTYLALTTAAHPAGAFRGQVIPAGAELFVSRPSDREELLAAPVPASAPGLTVLYLPSSERLSVACFDAACAVTATVLGPALPGRTASALGSVSLVVGEARTVPFAATLAADLRGRRYAIRLTSRDGVALRGQIVAPGDRVLVAALGGGLRFGLLLTRDGTTLSWDTNVPTSTLTGGTFVRTRTAASLLEIAAMFLPSASLPPSAELVDALQNESVTVTLHRTGGLPDLSDELR